jgi:hypothetical protein
VYQFVILVAMGRTWLRTFTHPTPTDICHAYIIGSTTGGLSERIGTFLIHDELTTFKDLRNMIEVVNDNGMNRRSGMYQDLLYLMENSANPHGYDRKALRQYRFGVIEGVGGQETGDTNIARDYDKTLVPRLIESDVETEPIKEVSSASHQLQLLNSPSPHTSPYHALCPSLSSELPADN